METQSIFMNVHYHFRSKHNIFKSVTSTMRAKVYLTKTFFKERTSGTIFKSVFL